MTVEALIAKVPKLSAPSASVVRLLALLDQPDADTAELVQVVQRDGVLSAKLLGLCNSAQYGRAEQVGSVEQAVLYLGLAEIHRLVMSICFGGALSQSLPGFAIEEQELWNHSLFTALTTEAVLAELRGVHFEPSLAYTAGLVHDIGKIVLHQTLSPDVQAAIRQLIKEEGQSRVQGERSVLGTDHAEIGACLLQRWNLPAAIVEAVAHHHQPVATPRPQLSAVVHVANCIAHELGSAPGWDGCAASAAEGVVEAMGLGPEQIQRVLMAAFESLQKVREIAALK